MTIGCVLLLLAAIAVLGCHAIVPPIGIMAKVSTQRFAKSALLRSASAYSMRSGMPLAAVIPGGAVSGTLTLGVMNGISLYSNILLARFALSWFPQLLQQFPVLRPIMIVTDPYLKIFRSVIPPIGGFDISALPAIFCLDILSQTTAALG